MNSKLPRPNWISTALLAVLFVVLFLQIKTPFNFYDEGFALTGAQRVANGEAPYRDFWGIYPPGQFYAIAAAFKIFGSTVMTARVYDTLVRFLTTLAVFLIGRRLGGEWMGRLSALTVGLLLAAATFYSYAVFPALGLGLWAIWCWLASLEKDRLNLRITAGVLLGLAALVRWDLGAYATAGISAAGYLHAVQHRNGRARWITALGPVLLTLLPMLGVAGLGYLAVGLASGFDNLFAQVFYFPVVRLHEQRALAYPALSSPVFELKSAWMQFYMPLLVLGFTGLSAGYTIILRPSSARPGDYAILALVIAGFGLFNQALSRYDFIHVTPASIAAYLALSGLAGRALAPLPASGPARSRGLAAASVGLLALLSLMYIPMSLRQLVKNTRAFPPTGCFSSIAKAACVYTDPNQANAVQYIQAMTHPDEPIFIGNTRHDKVFVGDSGFYYLADRPVATRYHEIHPGVVNTRPVQQEIIQELESQQVGWIVLVDIWESNEPNGSAVSTGVDDLDRYLAENFRTVTQQGWYHVQTRR